MIETEINIAFCWDFEDSTLEEGLRRLQICGFEGIELWPRWIDKFGIEAWQKALHSTRMQCFQLCPYFDFVHGPTEQAHSRDELERFLLYADALGCTRLRAFTGPVPPAQAVSSRQATAPQWEETILGLRVFCDRAAEQGVELCLECHEGMLSENSRGALRLLTGVDRPNLTTNLQIPLRDEDWQTTVDHLGPYTTHIHIHNWQGAMTMDNLTFVSEGDFDWLSVIRLLVHKYKRRVCLSVEHPRHNNKHSSWETARLDGPYLQELRLRVREQRI